MIVLYKGARGCGKTLTMVKDAYQYYLNGYRILSNFGLKFGEKINNDEVLLLDRSSNLFDCVLVIDEIQILFDSRNFGKDSNKKFSNFIQQIRKRNIIILCTTQYSNTIELRLRQHTDVVVAPHYEPSVCICKASYYDLTIMEDIDFNPDDVPKPLIIYFDASQVFDLYDTNEMLV